MPFAPLRPCPYPWCPELVTKGYCPAHAPQAKYERQQWKGSSHERGYGAAWRRLRSQVLRRDPICVAGWQCSGTALSTDADHIVPKEQGGLDVVENLRGLCSACHRFRHSCDKRNIPLPPYTKFQIP